MAINNKIPKVFISYSWDNEIHKNWVLELANKLTENGIYVFFDRYDLSAGKDMSYFMETSVKKADKVLLIMTPNYKIKAEKRVGGVGYEVSMVTAEIFKNQQSDKFIPIVRLGGRDNCTPAFVKSKIDIDMSNDYQFNQNFEELLRTIYNEHKVKRPNLGERPNFDTTSNSQKITNQNVIHNNYSNSTIGNGVDKNNIRKRVQEILVDKLGVELSEVTDEAHFVEDLGSDSLDIVELIMEFEKEFGVSISEEEAEKYVPKGTVGEAIRAIQKRLNN